MGEALITRRGGAVRTGMVADVQAFVMSDPALVNAKNGLIVLTNQNIGEPVTRKLASVLFIEDGSITTFTYLQDGKLHTSEKYKPELDIETGTVTCPDTQYGSDRVSFKGALSNTSVFGEYRYYLWD